MWRKSSPELIAFFTQVMETFPDAEHRKMFGYPCCFCNEKLFTGLHQENWIIRLNNEDRERFMNTYETSIFEPMTGRKMKEYVILPDAVLDDEELLLSWMRKSISYVRKLPAKKEKKKKTTV